LRGGGGGAELPKKAIARELKEELNLDLSNIKLLKKMLINFPHGLREGFFYTATADLKKLSILEPEKCQELKFFSWKEIQNLIDKNPEKVSAGVQALFKILKKDFFLFQRKITDRRASR
jgi:ADP-ribose pyrophosphatase YjhB (NUDIX family)